MKLKTIGMLGAVAAVGLAGCGLLPGVGGQQLLGSFQGDWNANVDQSKLRLSLVGLSAEGVTAYDNQLNIKDPNVTRGYVLELPQVGTEGSYKVIAYADDNGDGRFTLGEPVYGESCSKYMIYSNEAGNKTFFVGSVQTLAVKKGWNGYDAKTGAAPVQGESYPNYDLYRTGNCP